MFKRVVPDTRVVGSQTALTSRGGRLPSDRP